MRRRTLVVSVLALGVATAVLGLALARRTASQRLVDLGACLIGEPLAADEKASDRMLRLELARPRRPDPKGVYWPQTCAGYADVAARSLGLRPDHRQALAKLADDLANKEATDGQRAESADAIAWLRERRDLSASKAERPWRPVTMSVRGAAPPMPCQPWVTRESSDRAIFRGKTQCAVVSTPEERLSSIRVAQPEDALPPQKPPLDTKDVGGDGMAKAWCPTANGSAVVATTSNRKKRTHSIVTEFFDQEGARLEVGTMTVTSQFDDSARNPQRSLDASEPVASCGPSEIHVAWSWATLIGGKPNEELVVVSCVPGRCQTKTTVVHVETGRHSNCGFCQPSEDEFQLEPPTVIDLFGTTALIWNYDHALRVRIGTPEHLDEQVDHLLWYEADRGKAYFGHPTVVARHDVAIVGYITPNTPSETRFFRLAASGARELTISK